MNRKILAFCLATSVLAIASCSKENTTTEPESTTVTAVVAKNSTYTYTLSSAASGYMVSTPSAHAGASSVGTDASGNRVFSYTPTADYTGSDAVVLSDSSAHGGCKKNGGQQAKQVKFEIQVVDQPVSTTD